MKKMIHRILLPVFFFCIFNQSPVVSFSRTNDCVNQEAKSLLEYDFPALPKGNLGRQTDSLALVALYNSTNGAEWNVKSLWLKPGTTVDDWFGITWGILRLNEIHLSNNNLIGSLPVDLEDAAFVNTADFENNTLRGDIHINFSNLSNLSLYLAGNKYTFYDFENAGLHPDSLMDFSYDSQDTVFDLLYNGADNVLTVLDGKADSSTYQWYFDNSIMTGETNDTLYPVSSGDYFCLVNSTVFTLLELSSDTIEYVEEIVADSMALVALYDSTNGAGWNHTDNWLTGPVNSWYGVTVTNDRVTSLALSSNNLTGCLPPQIGELTCLTSLSMSSNNLTDSIPSEIGDLDSLEYLYLSSNQLSGEIPASIGNPDSLRKISLSSNQLSGEIPSSLGNLEALEWLLLSDNQLTGSIPTELGNLNSLEQLKLGSNQLTGSIPSSLSGLTNLTELSLSDNQLSGSIPTALGSMAQLETLYLSQNELSGSIPSELGNLTNLIYLNLYQNQLTGSIPTSLGSLTNLTHLQLYSNDLTGKIPAEIGDMTSLVYLALYNNQLSDTIPSQIGNLANLQFCFLYRNQLSGSIPASIAGMSSLGQFYVYENHLSGIIPFNSGRVASLRYSLSDNYFTFKNLEDSGIDPDDFAYFGYDPQDTILSTEYIDQLTSVTVLDGKASNNTYEWRFKNTVITGTVNDTIPVDDLGDYRCYVSNTSYPDLTLYSYSYSYEDSVRRDSTGLVALYNALDGDAWTDNTNWLNGPLDTWFGVTIQNERVKEINLSGNNLVGEIPDHVGYFSRMDTLDLSNNDIEGEIPFNISKADQLEYLSLANNKLQEHNIWGIQYVDSLRHLFLQNNRLSGTLYIETDRQELLNIHIEHNKFSFEDLEDSQLFTDSLMSFTYNPQDTVIELLYTQHNNTLTVIDGKSDSTTYQWYFDDAVLAGSTNDSIAPVDMGDYHCLINSTLYPSLTLTSDTFEYVNYYTIDSLALVDIYNNTNGSAWSVNTNWLTGNVDTWFGVKVEDDRVTGLTLPGNNLTGTLPEALGDLQALDTLNLARNAISGNIPGPLEHMDSLIYLGLNDNNLEGNIPAAIADMQNLLVLNLDSNRLVGTIPIDPARDEFLDLSVVFNQFTFTDFADSNIDPANLNSFTYAPQDTVWAIGFVEAWNKVWVKDDKEGNNRYQWYNDDGPIPGGEAENDTLSPYDDGEYFCIVHNTVYPALGIWSDTLDYYNYLRHDSLALVEFYDSTNGAGWTNNTNWLSGQLDDWYGVVLDGRHVTELVLTNNNLTGFIPQEIGNLNNLEKLRLYVNQITGSIPAEIGNLSSLEYLQLDRNQLSGTIPSEIGNLSLLIRLDLSTNQLSGSIPSQIGNLDSLETLYLTNNQISGSLPPEIGDMDNLEKLYLMGNQLSGNLPPEIGNLSKLESMYLYENLFTGNIPSELGQLSNVERFYLHDNQLEGPIPSDLGNLASCFDLRLADNKLTGSIPSTFDQFRSDISLDLSGNRLRGTIPFNSDSIFGQTYKIWDNKYTFTDLENSGLNPDDFNWFAYEPQDTVFELIYNDTEKIFTVSDTKASHNHYEWYIGFHLQEGETNDTLALQDDDGYYHCIVKNTLFPDLGIHSDTIEYGGNQLADSLALVTLYDSLDGANWTDNSNWLTGPLYTWYGIQLQSDDRVERIQLGINNLVGELPPQIGDLTKLEWLTLSGNSISGEIPDEIGNLKNLINLNLYNNDLEGDIPAVIYNLDSLTYLTLGLNHNLTGTIPVEIDNLSKLITLDLRYNQLSGSMPSTIGNLSKLTELNLANNNLSGSLPTQINNLRILETLHLEGNSFDGQAGILKHNDSLTYINLGNNQFVGRVPYNEEYHLRQSLYVNDNKFTFSDLEWAGAYPDSLKLLHYINQDTIMGLNFTEDDSMLCVLNGKSDSITYQWFMGGVEMNGETNDTLHVVTPGEYNCVLNNTLYPLLTLYSDTIQLDLITVEDNLQISDMIVSDGESECFNAYDTVFVAGDGTDVIFENGSTVNIIAGGSIFLLPGFHAQPGSYAYAWITTDGTFCDALPESATTVLALKESEPEGTMPQMKSEKEPADPKSGTVTVCSMKVYPNPNSGMFNVAFTGVDHEMQILIYNAFGQKVFQGESFESLTPVHLSKIKKGFYFVVGYDDSQRFVQKVIVE
ncbi:MAG: leucine-rich repeat domain-containing protein [Prolixibacteraceae bacterium]|nr:leucine-rich repeat domain-containing protein [Prolixibacteraceae bacterium]